MATERDDGAGSEHFQVAPQPDVARGDLVRERVAVLRGPVPDDVGDEHLAPVEPDAGEQLVEELARGADERPALHVLVVAGSLAEEEDPRLARPVAGDRLPGAAMERARGASADLVGDQPQLRRRSVLHRADYETAEVFIGALRAR